MFVSNFCTKKGSIGFYYIRFVKKFRRMIDNTVLQCKKLGKAEILHVHGAIEKHSS